MNFIVKRFNFLREIRVKVINFLSDSFIKLSILVLIDALSLSKIPSIFRVSFIC